MDTIKKAQATAQQSEVREEIIELLRELAEQKAAHRFSNFIFSVMEIQEVLEVVQANKANNLFYFINELLQLAEQVKDQNTQQQIFNILTDLKQQSAAFQFSRIMFHLFAIDEVLDSSEAKRIFDHINMINQIFQLAENL